MYQQSAIRNKSLQEHKYIMNTPNSRHNNPATAFTTVNDLQFLEQHTPITFAHSSLSPPIFNNLKLNTATQSSRSVSPTSVSSPSPGFTQALVLPDAGTSAIEQHDPTGQLGQIMARAYNFTNVPSEMLKEARHAARWFIQKVSSQKQLPVTRKRRAAIESLQCHRQTRRICSKG